MKRLGIVALILCGLSACAPTGAQQKTTNWDQIGGQAKVAKVNHIKSLISPGFY